MLTLFVVVDVLTHLFIIYPIFFYPENTCTRSNNNNHNDNEKNAKIEEKGKTEYENMGEGDDTFIGMLTIYTEYFSTLCISCRITYLR